MDSPFVSLIIPAFNAEAYIARAIESVLGQTHANLELIVVDDGSTDSTADAARRAFGGDERARLVGIANVGPAEARNRGLDEIDPRADYVMFVDADDHIAPDTVEYALKGAARGAELVIMGFTITNPDGTRRDYFEPEAVLDGETLGEALPRLYTANMLNQVWAKLFSAPLLRRGALRFPDYRWGEDRLFIFDCLERAGRVAVLPECKYFYVMHEGESLISRYYDKKPEVCCLADARMQALCARFGTKNDAGCRYMFVKSIFSCMTTLFSPSCALDYPGKRAYVRAILKNEQVQARSRGAFGSAPVKIMCAVMHTKLVWLNLLMFRVVAFVGRATPRLFMALKHKK